SPSASARPAPSAPWPAPAPPTPSPSPSPATASCAPTGPSPATAGASNASARCSIARRGEPRALSMERTAGRSALRQSDPSLVDPGADLERAGLHLARSRAKARVTQVRPVADVPGAAEARIVRLEVDPGLVVGRRVIPIAGTRGFVAAAAGRDVLGDVDAKRQLGARPLELGQADVHA